MSTSAHCFMSGRGRYYRSTVASPFCKPVATLRDGILIALLILPLLLTDAHLLWASSDMKWPEATAQLADFRTRAETCVALLKRYGNEVEIAQAQFSYGSAKAEVDAIITGLTTALAEGGQPDSLSSLQDRLNRGSASLQAFCGEAARVTPSIPGQKGVVDDIIKAALEPLIQAVSSAVATIYNNNRNDAALTRKTIQTQLEAARWLTFDQIRSAP